MSRAVRLTAALMLFVVFWTPADAVLRHGDQAVVVTETPQGTVNIRTIPVQRSGGDWGMGTKVGRAREGDLFKFLEKREFGNQGIWVRLEMKDGKEVWVSGRYLTQVLARDRLIVRPTVSNVRSRASRTSEKIGTVRKGDALGLVRKQDNWYLAVLPDGKQRAWIREDMVKHEPLAPAPKEAKAKEPEPAPVDYREVAKAALDQGKPGEAIEAYKKALEAEPNNGILHFELGKLLAKENKPELAIPHLRKATNGRPARPEAEFTLTKLLEARETKPADGAGEAPVDEVPEEDIEAGTPVIDLIADNAVYILPLAAIGSLAFIGVVLLLYRRRGIRASQPSFRRRKVDGGFDDVLKYAVEKRPVIREIEEAEKKLSEMDEALAKRFASFQEKDEQGRPRLPPGESAERLLKRIDGLRKTVLNQEERARIYSDLVMLQNDKISALDDEIEALKKLIQLDYQDTKKSAKKTPIRKAPARPSETSGD